MSENDAVVEETPQETPAEAEVPAETPAEGSSLPDDVEKLKGEIAKLRKENGAARTNAKQKAAEDARNEIVQQLGKTLGLVEDEAPTDAAELTRQIEAEKAATRKTQVELAIFRAASKAGGDPEALLDSRSFLATLDDTDPADAVAVQAAIEAAVQANPRLGVAPASRLPAPNPAQGSSASGAPSIGDQIADAEKRGDFKTSSALKAAQLAELAQKQVQR